MCTIQFYFSPNSTKDMEKKKNEQTHSVALFNFNKLPRLFVLQSHFGNCYA